jgi:hypothetical protein
MNSRKDIVKDIFQYILAAVIIGGFFVLMGFIVKHEIPPANKDLANQMFGALILALGMVISYFFGSNKDSAKKTEMLYKSRPPETSDSESYN